MAESTYTVERSVTIAAPPGVVHERIADFHQWPSWSPWEDIDPGMRRSYSGAESGPGAVYAWSGNSKAGQGRMEIVESTAPSWVRIDLAFEKPWKARNDTSFRIEPDGAGSRVVWTMTGKRTLVTRMMSLFTSMDSMLGRDFEKGLTRLKAATEGSATS
jgi:hypothetical protein